MKKIFSLVIPLILTITICKAQYVTIPDSTFRSFLQQQYPSCFNVSGQMDTTCSTIINETSLHVLGFGVPGMLDLNGIQYFKSLIYLNFLGEWGLTNLPSLPNSLDTLIWTDYEGISLPALPNSLKYLDCSDNSQLSSLPSLPNSLTYLNCELDQSLTALPSLPNTIDTLDLINSGISALTSLPNSLVYLNCQTAQIKGTFPAMPNSLKYLNCGGDHIDSFVSFGNSLTKLMLFGNSLTSLPALPNSLTYLDCRENQIRGTFPVLPNSITYLDCNGNEISGPFPTLPNSLSYFDCSDNNIYCLPAIPASLTVLNLDNNKVNCLSNLSNGLLINGSPFYTLCNPTNNINNCQSYPIMAGSIFYDNNSNGIKDVGEFYSPAIQLQLSDGKNAFTSSNGYYQIAAANGLGSYNLTVNSPSHLYKAVPILLNYTFTSFNTLVSQDVALQPIVISDSLTVNSIAYGLYARPGFGFPIAINYTNTGTTTLSPAITFNYDNTLLTYDSSSNLNVVNNGSSLSLTETNFVNDKQVIIKPHN